MGRKIPSPMIKYLYRTCPKCKDYLGVVLPDPPEPKTEIPIDAYIYGVALICSGKSSWGQYYINSFSIREANSSRVNGLEI